MLLTVAPATAFADVGIQAGIPTFAVNTESPTVVGFGGKEWVAVGYDGVGNTTASKILTLLLADGNSNQSYGNSQFNPSSSYCLYSGSTLQDEMNTAFNSLLLKEQPQVKLRVLAGDSGYYGTGSYNGDNIAGSEVSNAWFWPLSVNEVDKVNNALLQFSNSWWLRSPGEDAQYAVCVEEDGYYYPEGYPVTRSYAVRPAFYLNLSQVLFTSSKGGAGAKSTSVVGGGLINATEPTGALKFTMQSSSNILTCTDIATRNVKAGDTVNISYSGATTGTVGTNNYVSCIIRDDEETVVSYGKLASIPNGPPSSGTVSFKVPMLPSGSYNIQIFSEETNSNNYTDFCSAPVTIPMAINDPKTCQIGSTLYETLKEALKAVPTGGSQPTVIKLLENITYFEPCVIDNKNVTIDLNGKNLSFEGVIQDYSTMLTIKNNANVDYTGAGNFQVKAIPAGDSDGCCLGLNVTDNSTCSLTYVESRSDFEGGTIACSNNSKVTVNGNVVAALVPGGGNRHNYEPAVGAKSGSEITINGNISVNRPAIAINSAIIHVNGSISTTCAGGNAVEAYKGDIIISGNINATAGCTGVWANNNGFVTVDGVITANPYIKLGALATIKKIEEYATPTTKDGYLTYTDGTNSVWVSVKYTLTVSGGTGSGSYASGAKVNISANKAPAGKTFDKWIGGDGGTFANATSATTMFTMPANVATVTATYKDIGKDQILETNKKTQLSKPSSLKLNSKKASWNNVKNNNGYTLKVMQGKKTIITRQIKKNGTVYSFTKADKKKFKKGKKYTFTVVTKGKGNFTKSKSAKSKAVVLKKK